MLLILGIAWCAWTAQRVYSDLRDAELQAGALRDALSQGDQPGAEQALSAFQDASNAAAGRTDSLTWGLFQHSPVLGDDARGLAAASEVLSGLGADALPPLVDSAGEVTAGAYAPKKSKFPLASIAALEEPTTQSHAAFDAAVGRLDKVDSGRFLGPLQRSFDELRAQVTSAEVTLDAAARASQLMPTLLGGDGERDLLFVFQNNAEVRSTGGLPGNISKVHAERGRVDIVEQVSGASFGELPEPVLPLTPEEAVLFGPQLGTYFLDANFTPHFPRASELWRARWEQEFGDDIDAIFTVDPVTLSYLLAATGPVDVGGFTLTSANVVSVVEHEIYLNQPDPAAQDEILNLVAKRVFETFANGAGDPVGLIRALVRGVAEGRAQLHSFDEADQALINGTELSGALKGVEESSPQVGVYLNDATGSKLSYFLDYTTEVTAASCDDGRQELLGRFEITSRTPVNAALLPEAVIGYNAVRDPFIRPGQQFVVADVMAPVGGSVDGFTVDGERLDAVIDTYADRQVVSLAFLFEPGETHVVTWSMSSGVGQDGATEVSVTPGVAAQNESSEVPSAC